MRGILWTVLGLILAWAGLRAALQVDGPSAPTPAPALGAYSPGMGLREVFDTLPGAAADPRAELRLLTGNPQAWAARWRLLAGARERIDVSYFILKQDVFGLAFLGHLLHKAEQGVQVRVLLDAMGTSMSRDGRGEDYLEALVSGEGVEVKVYRPLFNRYVDALLLPHPAAVLASDHDKILLVDGAQAMIGGRNISAEYFAPAGDLPTAFYDADLLIRGEAATAAVHSAFEAQYASEEARRVARRKARPVRRVRELKLAYEAMDAWLHGAPIRPELAAAVRTRGLPWLDELRGLHGLRGMLPAPPEAAFDAPVRILDSYPRLLERDPISEALIRIVDSARSEVLIQSPYLVLPAPAVEVLARAARRGVRVTILTNSPSSSDNPLSQAIFLEQWPHLMARIPGLRLYGAGGRRNLHSKLAVIDNRLALVGTYNLDPLSMALNGELMAAVWSEAFAARTAAELRTLIAAGPPQVYRYRIEPGPDGGPPTVAFGPADHTDAEPASRVAVYSWLVRSAGSLAGMSGAL